MIPPPVEWPKQKHGRPGFSADTFLRYIFYIDHKILDIIYTDGLSQIAAKIFDCSYQVIDSVVKRLHISM
jgi:hypothetical protein